QGARHFLGLLELALSFDRISLFLTADANVTEELDDLVLNVRQQRLEELKGLALVLLLGVLAGIAAQADALAQAVHLGEMLLPERVENLQGDLLLELAHIGAYFRALVLVVLRDRLENALAQTL